MSKLEILKNEFLLRKKNAENILEQQDETQYKEYFDFEVNDYSQSGGGFNSLLEVKIRMLEDVSIGLYDKCRDYNKNHNQAGINSIIIKPIDNSNNNELSFLIRGDWEIGMLADMLQDLAKSLRDI
jgi:hypothetical protein